MVPVVTESRSLRWWARLAGLPALAVLLSLLGATWFVSKRVADQEQEAGRAQFDFEVRDAHLRVETRMDQYQQVLRGASGLFAASSSVERAEFRDYVASLRLAEHFTGIQGVGFSLLIPQDQLEAHTRALQAEGFPGYSVRPAGDRDVYTSIIYLEPFADRNLRAFGFDMHSEPVRREAMDRARDEGHATLSGKVLLLQETELDVQAGALMYLPVYRPGPPPATVEERRERLLGWVYMPFRMGDLMKGILGERDDAFDLWLYDGPAPTSENLLVWMGSASSSAGGPRFTAQEEVMAVDRPWTLALRARTPFVPARGSQWLVAAMGGTGLSALLAFFVWGLAASRGLAVRRERASNERLGAANASLSASEDRLNLVIDASTDGYLDLDLVTGVAVRSPRWWELAGRPMHAPVSKEQWVEEMHPDDAERMKAAYAALRSGAVATIDEEYRARRGDGWRWLRARGKVVRRDAAGKPTRIVGTLSDDDIAQERAAHALHDARLRGLSGRMNEAELVFDAGGHVIEVNDRAVELYGRPREALVGLHVTSLRDPATRGEVPGQFKRASEEGFRFETAHVHLDGSSFPVEVSSRSFSVDGKTYVHSLVRDLTAQRQQDADLRLLAGLTQSMQDTVLILDKDLRIVRCANSPRPVLGWSEAELVGHTPHEILDVEYPQGDGAAHLARLREWQPSRVQARLTRKDGRRIDLDIAVSVLVLANGERALCSVMRDVTQPKAIERALHESEARLSSIVSAMAEGMVLHGPDGVIVQSNPAAERILGLSADQLAGRQSIDPQWRTMHEDGTPFPGEGHPAMVALRTGASVRNVMMGVHKPDGSLVWISTSAEPLRHADGAPPFAVVATFSDVTELRHAADELQAASLAANSANQLKSQFLANMSHEIRTPLNAIIGLSELGLEENDGAKLHEYVGIIHRSGTALLGLINDILDFSKIEAGRMTLEQRPFVLAALLRSLRETMTVMAEAKGLTLVVDPCEASVVVGDELRVRQVLTNLLSNALKFTHVGSVRLRVEPGAEVGALRFVVTDTGIGMTPAQVGQLFQSFTQSDSSMTRRFGGTGLGLAISRQLARLMGGDVVVSSTLGVGSSFTFRVVFAVPTVAQRDGQRADEVPQSVNRAAAASHLEGRRVLLAEDNKVNQLLARTILEKAGVQVTLADNGLKAVAAAVEADVPFDAILMDLQMPEMDGYEATRTILARLGAASPPIIAMTAHAMSEERDHCLAAGMVAHVAKPIDVRALYSLLAQVMRPPPSGR